MRIARWIVAIVLAGTVVGLGVWYRLRPVEVPMATAGYGPLVAQWSADADCSGKVVEIAPELGGTVESLLVREGTPLRRGQLIAIVGGKEARAQVDAARANLAEVSATVPAQDAAAKAKAAAAEADLSRLERGYRPEEIRAAQAHLATTQHQLDAAQAKLAELEATLTRTRGGSQAAIDDAQAQEAASAARLKQAQAGPRAEDIAAAKASLAGALAAQDKAGRDLKRYQNLYASQAVSASDLDRAQEADSTAKAQADAARAHLQKLEHGTRPQEIEAAEADLRAARARVAQAQAAAGQVAEVEKSVQAAQAGVAAARAVRDEAAAQAEQTERGYRKEDVAAARAQLAEAQAGVRVAEGAQAGVAAAEATLTQAEEHLAKSRLVSPVDGKVVRKLVEIGDYVPPGGSVAEVVSPTRVWVTAIVDDQDIGKVFVGQKVKVSSAAYPGHDFEGKVAVVGGAAHPKGVGRARAKVVPVRIELDAAAKVLRPGMELDVEGEAVLRRRALLVPNEALLQEGGVWYVWVVEDGRAHKRQVETGASSLTKTEIVSGLADGARVVTAGKDKLAEGMRVAPGPAAAAAGSISSP